MPSQKQPADVTFYMVYSFYDPFQSSLSKHIFFSFLED